MCILYVNSYQGKTGWVPAAFLQPYNGPSDITANAPTQRIGNVMNVSDILNKRKAGETGLKCKPRNLLEKKDKKNI